MTDYSNGDDSPKTSTDLGMDWIWKTGASYGPSCVLMKFNNQYALEPSDCTEEANYICVKSICPPGFTMYDKKFCAKVMDSTANKDDATTACKNLNPGANLLMPKTHHDQLLMSNFLENSNENSEVYLGMKKDSSGHWMWDTGNPVFVSPLDWTTMPSAVIGAGGGYEDRIVNGIVSDDLFLTKTNHQNKWLEITLPEITLIPSIKVHTIYSSNSYARYLDVRVGNDTTEPTAASTSKNTRCEYKTNVPQDYENLIFNCPAPGLVGNIITIQKLAGGEEIRAVEVQMFGKHEIKNIVFLSQYTLFQIVQPHFILLKTNAIN